MRLCSTGLTAEQKGGVSKGRRLFAALWQVLFWGRPFLERRATGTFCGRHRPCGSVIRQDGRSLWWRYFPWDLLSASRKQARAGSAAAEQEADNLFLCQCPKVFKRVLQAGLQPECPGSLSPLLLAERTNLGVEAKAICYSPSLPQACRWVRAVADTEAAMPRLLQHRPELQRVYSKCSLPMGWRSHGLGAGQDAARGSEGQMPARINACAPPCRRCSGSFASRISRTEA